VVWSRGESGELDVEIAQPRVKESNYCFGMKDNIVNLFRMSGLQPDVIFRLEACVNVSLGVLRFCMPFGLVQPLRTLPLLPDIQTMHLFLATLTLARHRIQLLIARVSFHMSKCYEDGLYLGTQAIEEADTVSFELGVLGQVLCG
jgi:hypothetical protein